MKTVAFASGKGGTGKTTMTALFAHLAARELRVAVADADVEASNLPLALHVENIACESFAGGLKYTIRPEACASCSLCVAACRFDAIERDGWGSYRVDRFACEGCGACAFACPHGAVATEPSTAGEACSGDGTVGPVAFGQLGPGQDLSGKLVTEVRRLAADAASRHAADVLLIDGPPGIGCPLIAAVSSVDILVAVTEPTVSGAHDLERLLAIAGRLKVPVRVVLNKSDLSDDGAERIRVLCISHGLPLLAEVPFEPALAALLAGLAESGTDVSFEQTSAGVAVAAAWRALAGELTRANGDDAPIAG